MTFMQNNDFVRRIQSPGGDRKKSGSAHIDFPLLTLLVALCGLGLMVLYSAGGQDLAYVKRQATFMVLGFIIMFVVAQFEVRYWEKWAFVFYSLGLLLLIVVLFFGVGAKGAQRWLDIGFTRLQPAEFMKVGEKTGSVDEMFNSISIYYEAEVDNAVGALKQFIEPVMIVLIGGIIAALLLTLYQPIFNMGQVIK